MSFWVGLFLGIALGVAGFFVYEKKPWENYIDKFDELGPVTNTPGKDHESRGKKKRKAKRKKNKSLRDDADKIEVELVELTARDRQVISKGPKISLPEKDLDFKKGALHRSLNESEINKALSINQRDFIECIKESRGSAEIKASIKMRLLVNAKGHVEKKRVTAPRVLFDQGLFGCMSGVAQNMAFKSTGAYSVVNVPFDLY